MTDYAEFALPDGTPVRLELTPVGIAPASGSVPVPVPGHGDRDGHDDGGKRQGPPMPGGIGGVTPVGRVPRAAAALAVDGLQAVLRPLGPLLQEVHDAVSATANPPDEMQVQFGVQIGQDLKLGIVGANGQASMTISATWQLSGARTA
ncbi:CU044_2847 family protein [Streptomyces hygroscopicus]|uniref:CU044_2847 family protein n=1 Tax=Streptomyces hygroscopicus TaxID=1912 RepID=UPI000781ABDB|nr:CU044_2847 family protein [Streptomyces hygroscopicus]